MRVFEGYGEHPFDEDDRFHVHRPAGEAPKRTLVVFVHGLQGRGYGTWGEFPLFILQAGHDVAIFDYRSGMRRRRSDPDVMTLADILASELKHLDDAYRHVFLVGHSMGGILVETALTTFIERMPSSESGILTRLAGVYLLASPRSGSWLLPWPLSRLTRDTRILGRESSAVSRIERFRSSRLEVHADAFQANGRTFVPIYGYIGENDAVVKKFGALMGIPDSQVDTARGTHSSIVKPERPDAPSVVWLKAAIQGTLQARGRMALQSQVPDSSQMPGANKRMISHLSGARHDRKWREAYNQARHAVLERTGVDVQDLYSTPLGCSPVLTARILTAEAVLSDTAIRRSELRRDLAHHESVGALLLGYTPYGERAHEAASALEIEVAGDFDSPLACYVEASQSFSELRSLLYGWIIDVIGRHPDRFGGSVAGSGASTTRPNLDPDGIEYL